MPDATLIDTDTASLKDPSCAPEHGSLCHDPVVLAELERILSSPFFRSSPRSQEFLRHIVTCADVPGELKERAIGVAVFGRAADYDTGADAIVRVKAVDLRKRLAQYNSAADPGRSVSIELQTGSYLPKISRLEHPETSVEPAPRVEAVTFGEELEPFVAAVVTDSHHARRTTRWMAWVAIALALLIALSAAVLYSMAKSPERRFLRPFVSSSSQPIICLSHPNAYNLSLETVKRKGDASTAFRLRELLLREGRKPRISVAADLTMDDLKSSPAILLGGPEHNHWTFVLTQDLRFAFQLVDDKPRIIDRQDPSRFWEEPGLSSEQSDGDFVIITRLLATPTSQPVLCIAGIKAQGTVAGARIAFDDASLRQILRYAPDNWDQKNMQFVLHIQRRGESMPLFELLAATYW